MLKKLLRQIGRDERGITGLETAIILIAFVVVAAVFAYTALSAGLFSTQKSQEAVLSGLKEAQSTLELRGGVIAVATVAGDAGVVKQLVFTVAGVLGGQPIDFTEPDPDALFTGLAAAASDNVVVLSYLDQDQQKDDLYWTVTKLGDADDDMLLEQNEKFQITIGDTTAGAGAGNLVDALVGHNLAINKNFTLEVKTPAGAVLTVERRTPAYIDAIMNLN